MPEVLLVTGGAGYIGSHTLLELIAAGYSPIVVDNLSNSSVEVLNRIRKISGQEVRFIQGDVRDRSLLDKIFEEATSEGQPISAVIHFAAFKSVGESVQFPLRYYENNVEGTINLLQAMIDANVKRIVFSSSATVYKEAKLLPYTEQHALGPTNPYGQSKAMVEQVLMDVCRADDDFSAVALRYFNPIGAHPSGLIGEDPRDIPNNLFPFIAQVAIGKLAALSVYGDDYSTPDGTGVRDYVHVVDLASGHVRAVDYALKSKGYKAINLGTGSGTSVLQMVNAFEAASGRKIPWAIKPRRPGDLGESWADPELANRLLGWSAKRGIAEMCIDGWRWQSANPNGYRAT